MHNFYMWHGGNHYANWSTSDPLPPLARAPGAGGAGGALGGALGAASSAENTVRYANAAPLRSDGTRHEPLFSHLASIQRAFHHYAPALLTTEPTIVTGLNCTPACDGSDYLVRYDGGDGRARARRGGDGGGDGGGDDGGDGGDDDGDEPLPAVTFVVHACDQWNACLENDTVTVRGPTTPARSRQGGGWR